MKKLYLLYLFIFTILLAGLNWQLSHRGWVDADSYGLFNQTCHHEYDIETQIVSKAFFHLLPCDENVWKILGLFLQFCIFSSFYYGAKRFNLPPSYSLVIGLSGFLIGFLFSIEDDTIAYPLIAGLSFWLLSKITLRKSIAYLLAAVFLGFFVWKGAVIPMGVIGLGSIFSILGLIPFLYLASLSFFSDNWGNSSEAIIGNGFLLGSFILVPILFVRKKLEKHASLSTILVSLVLLSFFQPKWGEYVIIGAFPFFTLLREQYFYYQKQLDLVIPLFSVMCLLIFSTVTLLSQVPTEKQWLVLEAAKVFQDRGKVVYVDWGVGHYFEYLGGVANQKGGYHGVFSPGVDSFYYVGWDADFNGYDSRTILDANGFDGIGLKYFKKRV